MAMSWRQERKCADPDAVRHQTRTEIDAAAAILIKTSTMAYALMP
jgi:hypothetical protein